MTKSFDELTSDWSELRKQKLAEAKAELKVELEAAADYYERTGESMHILGSVEQRKIIENWKENKCST